MNNVTKLLPPGTNPQSHVQWPTFARGSLLVRTVGVSDYDSLQMQFQRRYHQGLQFADELHALRSPRHNAGDSLSGGGVGRPFAHRTWSGWDLKNDIGLSGFHTKHMRSCSAEATIFPGSGALLGGWRTDWVLSMSTADKLRRSTAPLTTGEGTGCYALVVGDPYEGAGTRSRNFYNPAAFANPADGRQPSGNRTSARLAGNRSQVIGPGMRQLDMGFSKQIRVGARRQLEFRAEAFNVTNTPAFNQPGVAELPGREELREHQQHAQFPASNANGHQVILVRSLPSLSGSARAGVHHTGASGQPRQPQNHLSAGRSGKLQRAVHACAPIST